MLNILKEIEITKPKSDNKKLLTNMQKTEKNFKNI